MTTTRLKGVADLRRHFLTSAQPWFFVSATNFNLLEMDTWVSGWRCLNYIDCFDGRHPKVYVPPPTPHDEFTSLEDVVNHLLEHKQVIDQIGPRGGRAVFLMFDDRTEELCRALHLEVALPAAALRREVDAKVSATRIADRAGVASVPNVLAPVDSYEALRAAARHLGPDLVVQTSFGDSGHTTFFISTEEEYREHAAEIRKEPEVKIMRRIRCTGAAVEGCVTRHGTLVAPMQTEIVGQRALTPYKGGWCGNELVVGAFPDHVTERARQATFTLGEALRRMGYRGYFELDFLVDLDDGQVYLGEINPRITGASSLTNLSAFAQADAPLFLFHLAEWSGIDYDLDVAELNARFADPSGIDGWSQLVLKHTTKDIDLVDQAPLTGVWRLRPDGEVELVRPAIDRRAVTGEDEAFWLRITGPGDARYEGADLGILLMRGRLKDGDDKLTPRAEAWIKAMRRRYAGHPLPTERPAAPPPMELGRFKLL